MSLRTACVRNRIRLENRSADENVNSTDTKRERDREKDRDREKERGSNAKRSKAHVKKSCFIEQKRRPSEHEHVLALEVCI